MIVAGSRRLACLLSILMGATTNLAASSSCRVEPSFADCCGTQPFSVPFSHLVVFGDSFSDTKNIYTASNETQPAGGWNGRYSNGWVWHEYLENYLQLGVNSSSSQVLAWGGATTNGQYITSFSTFLQANVPGVTEQVQTYLSGLNDQDIMGNNPLYVIFAGYNDYWYYVNRNFAVSNPSGETEQTMDFENVTSTIVEHIIESMETLAQNRAPEKSYFMVFNVVNMTEQPEALIQTPENLAAYETLVGMHNAKLSAALSKFEVETTVPVQIFPVDSFGIFGCINEDTAGYYGLSFIQPACYPDGAANPGCGEDIFMYKFWDLYHPTTKTHRILSLGAADVLFERLQTPSPTQRPTDARPQRLPTLAPTASPTSAASSLFGDLVRSYLMSTSIPVLIGGHLLFL